MKVYVLVGIERGRDLDTRTVLGVYSSADKAREQRDYVDQESMGGFDGYLCICRVINSEADDQFGHTLENF